MSRAFASALQQLADLSLKQGFVGVRSIELPLLPKFKSQGDGIDFDPLPPRSLVAPPVKLTVVRTTEWNGELVADPPTE